MRYFRSFSVLVLIVLLLSGCCLFSDGETLVETTATLTTVPTNTSTPVPQVTTATPMPVTEAPEVEGDAFDTSIILTDLPANAYITITVDGGITVAEVEAKDGTITAAGIDRDASNRSVSSEFKLVGSYDFAFAYVVTLRANGEERLRSCGVTCVVQVPDTGRVEVRINRNPATTNVTSGNFILTWEQR